MALTLDSIFRPMNEYFLGLFQTGSNSPVIFRFDKFGSILSDNDFIDPKRPDLGYSPSRARETLSDLVNHIPFDSGDGMSIVFSLDTVDNSYFYRILSPAQAYVTSATPDSQRIIEAFSTIKANALKTWENIKLESLSGLMFQYKPAIARPEDWYNKSATAVWTRQSFSVNASTPPLAPERPQTNIWRLKLSDVALTNVLQTKVEVAHSLRHAIIRPVAEPVSPALMRALDITPRMYAAPSPRTAAATLAPPIAAAGTIAEVQDIGGVRGGALNVPVLRRPSRWLQDEVVASLADVRISDRLRLAGAITDVALVKPAATDSVEVSFDYCLVHIQRPWYIDAFVTDRSWYVPGLPKGSITSGAAGNSFQLLPVAFLAIKNLEIEANWNTSDVDTAAAASDFGPFKVVAGIKENKLTHEGTQVVGWMLDRMPELPPNDPPV